MINMLGGMQGNLTEALEFANVKGNMFPFESPPNKAVSDYYTLVRGGAGQPETEMPSPKAMQKALANIKDVPMPKPPIPFAEPGANQPSINLIGKKLGGMGADALGIARGATREEVADAVRKAKAKLDSGIA